MKLNGVCKDCRFYEPDTGQPAPAVADGTDGRCRFFPQRPILIYAAPGPTIVYIFSRTHQTLGCGQFDKEKP